MSITYRMYDFHNTMDAQYLRIHVERIDAGSSVEEGSERLELPRLGRGVWRVATLAMRACPFSTAP